MILNEFIIGAVPFGWGSWLAPVKVWMEAGKGFGFGPAAEG